MNSVTDQEAPGWDAISAACAALYPAQEPKHYGTLISYRLGGPDPLDGISAWQRTQPWPHWHFVTYGFSELYGKESNNLEVSGYGFELSFRLRMHEPAEEPPTWALNFLQNLARYVFQSGNVFRPGDWLPANGPIARDEATRICSMAFIPDPELPAMRTPHGELAFLQVVGLTADEERAAKRWKTSKLLEVFAPAMPLWITDLARGSLLEQAELQAQVEAGTRRDGSSTGMLWTDALAWRQDRRLLRQSLTTIVIGALQAGELAALLPLRLPFGRPLRIVGESASVVFSAGEQNRVHVEDEVLHVQLTADAARALGSTLKPQRGSYAVAGVEHLRFEIQPTSITDSAGNLLQTVG